MKKEITWKELIKRISAQQRSNGKFSGLKEVFGEAKKEWDLIKSGKHDLFSVGQGVGQGQKNNNNKTVKKTRGVNKNNKSKKNKMNLSDKKIKLCDKCKSCLCVQCIKRNKL